MDEAIQEARRRTLREDVHWVIDLNIHVVADSSQFTTIGGDHLAILRTYPVR